MKKLIWAVIGVIVVLLLLNFLGILRPLNEMIPQDPDLSCRTDDDCAILLTGDCRPGCDFIAANKEWRPLCPFNDPAVYVPCATPLLETRCSAGVCVAVNASRS